MRLETYRQLWGVEEPFERSAAQFKARGYTGLEVWIGRVTDGNELRRTLEDHDLKLITLVATEPDPVEGHTVRAHLDSFERQVVEAMRLGSAKINAHGGRDAWSAVEQDDFFGAALDFAGRLGAAVSFETHRGRPTFSPWATDRLLRAFPSLRLTLDLSHWVVVSERLIDDQLEIIRRAAAACEHVHARVGYDQGPQVPDPRAPEYEAHLTAHERWWGLIWDAQEERGDGVTTLAPEFGPPPYLHTLPYTRAPVADLEEVCEWMTDRLRELFAERREPRPSGRSEATR